MPRTEAATNLAIVAVIPARFASTRFPGKPLSDIHGKPMVRHVYERVREARTVGRVLVATDDERIASAVRAFGGEVVMTAAGHVSGTDRVAEAVAGLPADIVVNVQGDEPMLDPAAVDAAIEPLRRDAALDLSTLSVKLGDADEMLSPQVVKVVTDARGRALYFSRSPIPFVRRGASLPEAAAAAVAEGLARKHVGLYAFRREALARFVALPPSRLEQAEALEQLRALENGMAIGVVEVAGRGGVAVDTPEDLETVRALLARPAAGGIKQ
jgi:3-deoxy-manno-octulosonate cytidylyltransferase (CMP-KDO synthetase)